MAEMTHPEQDSPVAPAARRPRWLLPRVVAMMAPTHAVLVLIVAAALAGVHVREIYIGDYWPTRVVHFAAVAIEARLLKVILNYLEPYLSQQRTPPHATTEQDAS